jgi:protein TonB
VTGSGYLSTSNRHPVSLGLAASLTGVGLAALLLAQPYIRHVVKQPPLTAEEIAIDVPPPLKTIKEIKNTNAGPIKFNKAIRDDRIPAVPTAGPVGENWGSSDFDFGTSGTFEKIEAVARDPVLIDPSPDPRFAGAMQPPYPPSMQRMEMEGTATVRVQIDIDGRVLRVESVGANNEAFLTATCSWALKHWRFKPATRDGVPTQSWKIMTVRFQMTH